MLVSRNNRGNDVRWIFWLFIFNIFLATLISCLNLRPTGITHDLITLSYFFASAISHYSTIAITPFILIFFISFYLKRHPVCLNTLLVLLFSISLTLLFIDIIIYGLYRFHLNGMVWNLIASGVAVEMLSIPWITWFAFAMVVGTIILVQIIAVSLLRRYTQKLPKVVPVAVLIVIGIFSTHAVYAWADAARYVPLTRYANLLPAYRPLTATKLMNRLGFKQVPRSPAWSNPVSSALQYPLEELQCSIPDNPQNILLIIIDSWRFDMMTPEATPYIAKFSTESWVFENNFSAGNTTRFSIFSLMYGVYGTYWRAFLAEQQGPVLLHELNKRGYDLGVFASAPLTNPEFDRTVFVDLLDRIQLKQEGKRPIDRDVAITDKMLKFIEEHDRNKPFFGLLFYDAIHARQFPEEFAKHTPYLEQVNYITLGPDQDPKPMLNTYLNALAFVDSKVGAVLEALESKGLLENTTVIITGDHGEEINDLGLNYWGHNSNFSKYQVRTPLVARVPGHSPARFTHVTTHLDVVPTLMQVVLGCSTPASSYSNGVSLTDPGNRPFVHVSTWDSFALVEENRIHIVENKGGTEIVDSSYRPIEGESLNSRLSRMALDGMSLFYKR